MKITTSNKRKVIGQRLRLFLETVGFLSPTGKSEWVVTVRCAKKRNEKWWQRAMSRAKEAGLLPVLVFQAEGQSDGWLAEMRACDCLPSQGNSDQRVVMRLQEWKDMLKAQCRSYRRSV